VIAAGIDLSGRSKGTTAFALVRGQTGTKPELLEIEEKGLTGASGDQRLLDVVLTAGPAIVAIDAPLFLPHAVTCHDPHCQRCFPADGTTPSYATRELERPGPWQVRGHAAKGPMPTVMLAAIAFRAIYVSRMLERNGLRVVETWPMGVYRVMEERAGEKPSRSLDADARLRLLEPAVDDPHALLNGGSPSIDRIDAVAAAYAGWCVLAGTAECVDAAADEGAIWIPRRGR
jgi:predicted nuclease with RNAse H fold